jgi:predicted O-methyltransferase YrrM
MNIFLKFIKNINMKKSNQNKTNSKTVPIHKTFKDLLISHELLKNNSIHSEFLDHIKEKKLFFSQDWFTYKIDIIKNILNKYQKNYPKKILEIGSYEGLSMVFFLYLFNSSKIDVVDLFLSQYKEIFDKNFKIIDNGNIRVFKKNSHNFLSNNNESYDLIFVDGGHGYLEVLVDLLYSYKFLNLGGILLIDDYDWDSTDKSKSVRLATNHFLDIIENTFEPIYHGQFAAIIKKKTLILIKKSIKCIKK